MSKSDTINQYAICRGRCLGVYCQTPSDKCLAENEINDRPTSALNHQFIVKFCRQLDSNESYCNGLAVIATIVLQVAGSGESQIALRSRPNLFCMHDSHPWLLACQAQLQSAACRYPRVWPSVTWQMPSLPGTYVANRGVCKHKSTEPLHCFGP